MDNSQIRTIDGAMHTLEWVRKDNYFAIRAWVMFDEGNGRDFEPKIRETLHRSLKGTKEAHAFNYLISTFVDDSVLAVCRLLDKRNRDRACFDTLLHYWQDENFRTAILDQNRLHSRKLEYSPDQINEHLRSQIQAFEELETIYRQFWGSPTQSALYQKRTQALAHRLLNEDQKSTTFDQLIESLEEVKRMYRLAELALRFTSVDPDQFQESYRVIAKRFWDAFELGMIETQRLRAMDSWDRRLNWSFAGGPAHY